VSTVHQASATRHCYTADAAGGAVDPVFLKPIGGQCVANLVGISESPLDAQVWVSSATDLNCRGEAIPNLSMQDASCVWDSLLLAGHGVVVCVVGTELCWQLHCALPKE
jgi:hypothetical protein